MVAAFVVIVGSMVSFMVSLNVTVSVTALPSSAMLMRSSSRATVAVGNVLSMTSSSLVASLPVLPAVSVEDAATW